MKTANPAARSGVEATCMISFLLFKVHERFSEARCADSILNITPEI
jgi:hypothetical protein